MRKNCEGISSSQVINQNLVPLYLVLKQLISVTQKRIDYQIKVRVRMESQRR